MQLHYNISFFYPFSRMIYKKFALPCASLAVLLGEVQKSALTSVNDIFISREGQRSYRGEGVTYANREVQTYVIIIK